MALRSVTAFALLTSSSLRTVAQDSVTFVDFSSGDTGMTWVAENDPVMGGVSDR